MTYSYSIETKHGHLSATAGTPLPLGGTVVRDGINFAVYSAHATGGSVVIYRRGGAEPLAEIPFPLAGRFGHVFTVHVSGLNPAEIEYGYRMQGANQPEQGHRFDSSQILLDPYARQVGGRNRWADETLRGLDMRSQLVTDRFDWEGDRPLNLPFQDLIIYEAHVRSMTAHPNSGVAFPGTYAGFIEKIPYLQELGINCVELLPIQSFDEFESHFTNPQTGAYLKQYWGYGSAGFFAPKAGLAASGEQNGQVNELKSLVKALHQAGIEIFMDVVFNHTGEGGSGGETFSFRGLDNKTYYLLDPKGAYQNFSGTGNTLNCNHPVVREFIVDCLRYWVLEYHIDGFRFDLASAMVRDEAGHPMVSPPLIEAIAKDPILAQTKLVAEAWDAAGLYQVGSFPHYGRWSEWNGRYRDTVRRFLSGNEGEVGHMVQRLLGSPDLYKDRPTYSSINFINCHDGFTLADLFMYNDKHNEANGEGNRDGTNDNASWNCGIEGPTDDVEINRLRQRLMRSALVMLMVSQGVPLFHMGDEVAFSKQGNNNTYGHDNELNWFDWDLVKENQSLLHFCQQIIAFRKSHITMRSVKQLGDGRAEGRGYPYVSWHGVKVLQPDWSYHSHTLAFMLDGRDFSTGELRDNFVYVAMNMHYKAHRFELPPLPEQMKWHLFCDTGRRAPYEIVVPGQERPCDGQLEYVVEDHAVVILVGR